MSDDTTPDPAAGPGSAPMPEPTVAPAEDRAATLAAQELATRSAGAMWADDLASKHAGIDLVAVAPGRSVCTMTVSDTMINGHAICHGAFIFMLADTAFALACNTYGPVTVAQDCDVVFLRPARLGDALRAVAVERARFGRNGIYDVTVTRAGEVVAEFRGRSRSLPAAAAG